MLIRMYNPLDGRVSKRWGASDTLHTHFACQRSSIARVNDLLNAEGMSSPDGSPHMLKLYEEVLQHLLTRRWGRCTFELSLVGSLNAAFQG